MLDGILGEDSHLIRIRLLLHLADSVFNPGDFVAGGRLSILAQHRIGLGTGELPVNFVSPSQLAKDFGVGHRLAGDGLPNVIIS